MGHMQHIGDIYNFVKFLSDKDGRGYVSPEEFSQALEAGQLAVFNAYRASGALDNLTGGALSPFVASTTFTTSASGEFTKPTGFVQVQEIVVKGLTYTPILFNELREARISQLYPLESYPRYMEQARRVVLYPQKTVNGTLTYLRMPAAPVMGYTVDSTTGLPVYNSGTSVQLEIPEAYWLQVIHKALPYIGVNLSDADLVALSQQKEAQP